jgi:hypothetical protein
MRKIRIDITDEHVDISELELPKTVHINAVSKRERAAFKLIGDIEKELRLDLLCQALILIGDFKEKWGIK